MGDRESAVSAMLYGAHAPSGAILDRSQDAVTDARLRTLLGILRRRVRLISCIVIGGALAVACLACLLPPRYTAKAQIVVVNAHASQTNERTPASGSGPDQATMQTQVSALQAHDLLVDVLTQLAADPEFLAIQQRAAGTLPLLSKTGSIALAGEKLERHLRIFQEAGSHVISVAFPSPNPAEAAAVVNRITRHYLAAGEQASRSASNQAIEALTKTIAELREQSESLEKKVTDYQARHGMHDAYKTNVIDQKLGDLNHQLSIAQSELAARRTRHADLAILRGTNGNWDMLLLGQDAQGLVELHGQADAVLAGRQENIAVIPNADSGQSGEPPPATLRGKIRRELDQALQKLSHDERVATAQEAAIEQRLGAVQRASDDVDLHDLVAAAASAHRRYERLVLRRNDLQEMSDDVTAPARLLSWAAVPDRPSSLNPLLFVAPALVALLVIGCLVALLCDGLDQRIYTGAEAASILGFRCAGMLPLLHGAGAAGMAAVEDVGASPTFTEALRGIIVSLQLLSLRKRKPQVILVTSSVAGEGKTTLARNLAVCAAGADVKVLLLGLDNGVQAEAAPPAVSDDEFGWLADIGSRESRVAALSRSPPKESHGEKFDLEARARARMERIPAGPRRAIDYLRVRRETNDGASLLFSIEEMSALLRRQRALYDLILIDSAAVLEKSEVRLLAAISDQILFAVRWRKTRRDQARAALALLQSHVPNGTTRAATISVALTRVELDHYAVDVPARIGRTTGMLPVQPS